MRRIQYLMLCVLGLFLAGCEYDDPYAVRTTTITQHYFYVMDEVVDLLEGRPLQHFRNMPYREVNNLVSAQALYKDSLANRAWDIAFSTDQATAYILSNTVKGVKAYLAGDTANWSSVTAQDTVMALQNSYTNWYPGAFNANSTDHLSNDWGWGQQSPDKLSIIGDSIYVLKLANDDLKKIWIQKRDVASNQYQFRYANLDGTNDTTITVQCFYYQDKRMVYYSFDDAMVIDLEPRSQYWDYTLKSFYTDEDKLSYGVFFNEEVKIKEMREDGSTIVSWLSYMPSDADKVLSTFESDYDLLSDRWLNTQDSTGVDTALFFLVYRISDADTLFSKIHVEKYDTSTITISTQRIAEPLN